VSAKHPFSSPTLLPMTACACVCLLYKLHTILSVILHSEPWSKVLLSSHIALERLRSDYSLLPASCSSGLRCADYGSLCRKRLLKEAGAGVSSLHLENMT
jgi:hypothetical protein